MDRISGEISILLQPPPQPADAPVGRWRLASPLLVTILALAAFAELLAPGGLLVFYDGQLQFSQMRGLGTFIRAAAGGDREGAATAPGGTSAVGRRRTERAETRRPLERYAELFERKSLLTRPSPFQPSPKDGKGRRRSTLDCEAQRMIQTR